MATKMKQPKQTYYCDTCELTLQSEPMLKSHLEGKKHKSKAARELQRQREEQAIVVLGITVDWMSAQFLQRYFSDIAYPSTVVDVHYNDTKRFGIVTFSDRESKFKALKHTVHFIAGTECRIAAYVPTRGFMGPPAKSEETPEEKEKARIEQCATLCQCQSLEHQMRMLRETTMLTPADHQQRYNIVRNLTELLHPYLPGCSINMFGSSVNGYGVQGCDMDMYLDTNLEQHIPLSQLPGQPFARFTRERSLNKLIDRGTGKVSRRKLQEADETLQLEFISRVIGAGDPNNGYSEVFPVKAARCPVIKFKHRESDLHCDITIANRMALRNTHLIRCLAATDERIPLMVFAIRYWAKIKDLAGQNLFSSYALTWLVYFYLQNTEPPVLPSVEKLAELAGERKIFIDGWDCSFLDELSLYPKMEKNNEPIHRLMGGFFDFWRQVNFKKHLVNTRTGKLDDLATRSKDEDYAGFAFDRPMCIQDPFVFSHNVTGNVPPKTFQTFMDELHQASVKCKRPAFFSPPSSTTTTTPEATSTTTTNPGATSTPTTNPGATSTTTASRAPSETSTFFSSLSTTTTSSPGLPSAATSVAPRETSVTPSVASFFQKAASLYPAVPGMPSENRTDSRASTSSSAIPSSNPQTLQVASSLGPGKPASSLGSHNLASSSGSQNLQASSSLGAHKPASSSVNPTSSLGSHNPASSSVNPTSSLASHNPTSSSSGSGNPTNPPNSPWGLCYIISPVRVMIPGSDAATKLQQDQAQKAPDYFFRFKVEIPQEEGMDEETRLESVRYWCQEAATLYRRALCEIFAFECVDVLDADAEDVDVEEEQKEVEEKEKEEQEDGMSVDGDEVVAQSENPLPKPAPATQQKRKSNELLEQEESKKYKTETETVTETMGKPVTETETTGKSPSTSASSSDASKTSGENADKSTEPIPQVSANTANTENTTNTKEIKLLRLFCRCRQRTWVSRKKWIKRCTSYHSYKGTTGPRSEWEGKDLWRLHVDTTQIMKTQTEENFKIKDPWEFTTLVNAVMSSKMGTVHVHMYPKPGVKDFKTFHIHFSPFFEKLVEKCLGKV